MIIYITALTFFTHLLITVFTKLLITDILALILLSVNIKMDKGLLKSKFKKVLGKWLHISNSNPIHKFAFYEMKEKILDKYGIKLGIEYQEFTRDCFTCNGSGLYTGYSYPDGFEYHVPCNKCDGSGIYDFYYVELFKYKLGNYYFHIPGQKLYYLTEEQNKNNPKIIKGYIKHNNYSKRLKKFYSFILAIFCDLNYFRVIYPFNFFYHHITKISSIGIDNHYEYLIDYIYRKFSSYNYYHFSSVQDRELYYDEQLYYEDLEQKEKNYKNSFFESDEDIPPF